MKRLALAALFSLSLAAGSSAAWWAENDFEVGSNGLNKESLAGLFNAAPRFATGLNASYYRDSAAYKERTWAFRVPLMYSAPGALLSLKPFVYPVSSYTRSGAAGARAAATLPLGADDENYTRLTLAAAWARQRAMNLSGAAAASETFSEAAAEAQVEKAFYGQFYFMGSAAGFSKPAGVSNRSLVKPAMEQAELAYLGTFRQITALPEWAMSLQIARNMRPEFDSHLYAGYSKISYRGGKAANSGTAGIKISITEKSTLDLAYNLYKEEAAAWKSYYKIFLQAFF
jgi:hypothetical protein